MKRPGRFIIVDDSTIHDSNYDDDIPHQKRQRMQDEPPSPTMLKRKAMFESRPSLKSDHDGTVILIHDPKYFFEDDSGADCFIRVEKILFKVRRLYRIAKDREDNERWY